MRAQPMRQTDGVHPLPVQCRHCFLARAHGTLERAAFTESANRELYPLALAGRRCPECDPIIAPDDSFVADVGVGVAAYARQARLVVATLNLAIFRARHRKVLTKDPVTKCLRGAQRFVLAAK